MADEAVTQQALAERGLARRKAMLGTAGVEARMQAAGAFGAPLQQLINGHVYGEVWSHPGLTDAMRSLVMLGITAASNRPQEFRVHARGALANGCTAAQLQNVLMLVTAYCGVPAAIEPYRIVAELLAEPG
jgi:4-carboxymuconolactone decarboxylase